MGVSPKSKAIFDVEEMYLVPELSKVESERSEWQSRKSKSDSDISSSSLVEQSGTISLNQALYSILRLDPTVSRRKTERKGK